MRILSWKGANTLKILYAAPEKAWGGFFDLIRAELPEHHFEATYSDDPQSEFIGSWNDYVLTKDELAVLKNKSK